MSSNLNQEAGIHANENPMLLMNSFVNQPSVQYPGAQYQPLFYDPFPYNQLMASANLGNMNLLNGSSMFHELNQGRKV